VIAISDRADIAIDGRFNRENPEALEQMAAAARRFSKSKIDVERRWCT
jgi:hypothetical protein